MIFKGKFLESRVARRIVLLFVLAASPSIGTLAYLSYHTEQFGGIFFPVLLLSTLVIVLLSQDQIRKHFDHQTTVALFNDHQIHYDALTNLPNRLFLKNRLEQAIARATRGNTCVAVFFIGLDRFKEVNDSLGHGAGDELLNQVAQALRRSVRSSDTVVRFGGDEFTVIIPEIAKDGDVSAVTAAIAEKIRDAFTHPFLVQGHPLRVTVSIGIAVYPDDADCADDLLKNVDSAMNHAKKQGRDNVQCYSQELNATALERLQLESHLRWTLEREELMLYFQPQIDMRTGRITGAEALIRWRHPDLGMVSPGKFIPLAEETGLIVPIGQWVLDTACAQMKSWEEQGFPRFKVGVNLSAQQFRQPNLAGQVERALSITGIRPEYLDLEITEGASMGDVKAAIATLHSLKAMGVHISIDDFGTGYSSLSYLKQFPIDTLKIDQSFVRGIPNDAGQMSIAKAIIGLARSLNLRVIAEGVETNDQLQFLKEHHCEEAQGYLIGKPMPAEEFEKFLVDYELSVFPPRQSAA
jgi:diguanylate cyclase (GGDEF)-like protein